MAHRGRESADDRLAVQIAAGRTVRAAAEAAGVSERTAHRRAAHPKFRAKVAAFRDQWTAAALGRLSDGLTAAADTIRGLLASESEAVRLRAAEKLIDVTLALRSQVELADRITELERAAE